MNSTKLLKDFLKIPNTVLPALILNLLPEFLSLKVHLKLLEIFPLKRNMQINIMGVYRKTKISLMVTMNEHLYVLGYFLEVGDLNVMKIQSQL